MDYRYQNYQNLNNQVPYSNTVKVAGDTNNDGSSNSLVAKNTQSINSCEVDVAKKIDEVKNDLSRGNITVEEAVNRFKEIGITINRSISGNNEVLSFEYENKTYTITAASSSPSALNKTAGTAASLQANSIEKSSEIGLQKVDSIDSIFVEMRRIGAESFSISYDSKTNKIKVQYKVKGSNFVQSMTLDMNTKNVLNIDDYVGSYYTDSYLNSVMDKNYIDTYFQNKSGFYSIKQEFSQKFSTIDKLVAAIKEMKPYQDQTILANFLQDVNLTDNSEKALYQTVNGDENVNINNKDEVVNSMQLASGKDLAELQKSAIDKLVSDFTSGCLNTEQAKVILSAAGVNNCKINTVNNIITITFEFNNKKYSISCQKEAAADSTDFVNQQVYTKESLSSKGATQEIINKFFIETSNIDGTVSYALKLDKNEKEFLIAVGELTGYTQNDIKALNLGLSEEKFNEILEFYFEKVSNMYVLNFAALDEVKNAISEVYAKERLANAQTLDINDEYNGYAVADKETYDERMATLYYLYYINGYTAYENEDEYITAEYKNSLGLYPYENVFENLLGQENVRKYLSDAFGIQVPNPKNEPGKFKSFVESYKDLWNKAAQISATNESGMYTGEYKKSDALKCFGLALSDDKFKDYVQSFVPNTQENVQTSIQRAKAEHPELSELVEDIFNTYGADGDFAVKAIQAFYDNIDSFKSMDTENLKVILLSPSMQEIVNILKSSGVMANTSSLSISQETVDNLFKDSGIKTLVQGIADYTGSMGSIDALLSMYTNHPEEFADRFVTQLEGLMKSKDFNGEMSIEAFTDLFSNALNGKNWTGDDLNTLLGALSFVGTMSSNIYITSSGYIKFKEDSIKKNNWKLDWKTSIADSCELLEKTLKNQVSTYWVNVLGAVPGFVGRLLNPETKGVASLVANLAQTAVNVATSSLVTIITKSFGSGFGGAIATGVVGGAFTAVSVVLTSILKNAIYKSDDNKLKFSLKKGWQGFISSAKNSISNGLRGLIGSSAYNNMRAGNGFWSKLGLRKLTEDLPDKPKQTIDDYILKNVPQSLYTDKNGNIDSKFIAKIKDIFTDKSTGEFNKAALSRLAYIAHDVDEYNIFLNAMSGLSYEEQTTMTGLLYSYKQQQWLSAFEHQCRTEFNSFMTGINGLDIDDYVSSLESYMMNYADSDTSFMYNAKAFHSMRMLDLMRKYSHGGSIQHDMNFNAVLAAYNSSGNSEFNEENQYAEPRVGAPKWFIDGLKNGTIYFNKDGELVMSATDKAELDNETEQFNYWLDLYKASCASSGRDVESTFMELYKAYQEDMVMFAMWLALESVDNQKNYDNLSWKEKYKLYRNALA